MSPTPHNQLKKKKKKKKKEKKKKKKKKKRENLKYYRSIPCSFFFIPQMDNPHNILQQIETIIDEEQAKNSPHTLNDAAISSPALNALVAHSPRRSKANNLLNSINPPALNLSQSTTTNSNTKTREEIMAERKRKKEEKKLKAARAAAKLVRQKKGVNKKKDKKNDKKPTHIPRDPKNKPKNNKSKDRRFDDPVAYAKHVKGQLLNRVQAEKRVPLFSHLAQYEKETSLSLQVSFGNEAIHPAILRVGLHFTTGNITGANARCVAMLLALKEFISDYKANPNKAISRDLSLALKPIIRFFKECRPNSISMGSAIRYLKITSI